MTWLISTSLRFRVLVLALAVTLIGVGIRTAEEVPLDVFPEFAPPLVEIQTEVPGISTEEVESLVTVPIENALNGIPFLKTVRSKSVLGLSSVQLIFESDTDLLTARQLVQERLTLVATRLPVVARPPVILPPLSSLSRAMKIGLWSDTLTPMELTVLAKWTIRPRLMAVQGVANVAIWGEKDRQFQVLVDPVELQRNNLTLREVEQTVRNATAVGAGGFVDSPNQRLAVRHVPAIREAEDLGNTVVKFDKGNPIRLEDVTDVRIGTPPLIGDAVINGGPGIMLIVEKQPWANTLEVTRNVEKVMETLKPGLGDVQVDTTIFRPATFVERAIDNLTKAMWIGCGLVILVLIFFLFDWRAALISATAIPLSLLAAVLVLYYRGGTINTMVLAGLVIALGEVVDDAIIDVENIVRRLRLNQEAPKPLSSYRVVLQASLEVRSAVVYASLIVILAFLPVFFLQGLAGSFFRPLAMSYGLAIFASLVVALTVTPALSLMLLPQAKHRRKDAPLVLILKRAYRAILPIFTRRPSVVMGGMVLAGGLAVFSFLRLGDELLPKFKETDFLMHWVEKPGTSIEMMNRITIRAGQEMMAIDGVNNFGAHIGRAEVADEVVGPNFTELWISIDEKADYEKTIAAVQEVVDGYPGLYRDLLTYLTERIKEVLTGTSAAVVVRIYGPDLKTLREKAREVEAVLKDIEGVTNLNREQQDLVPQIVVELRPDAAARFGLTAGDVLRSSGTLIQGLQVGEVYDNQKIFRVVIQGTEGTRRDLDALGEILIDTPTRGRVPLRDVAEIRIEPTPNVIKRKGASRRIDVLCNVKDRDLGSVAREIEETVKSKVYFPQEYHPEVLGEYAEARRSQERLLFLLGLSLTGIVVLLYVDFQSLRHTLLLFLTLPFALMGGIAGAFLGGGVISLGSLVGFVTVLGIAVRNGIMLITHYRHLEDEEGMVFGPALILRGAEKRLAPILMTALTTGLALLPLVLAGNVSGHEIEYPMAWVILGGLVTATALNLLVVPTLYAVFGKRNDRELALAKEIREETDTANG